MRIHKSKIIVCVNFLMLLTNCKTLGDVLNDYGYLELRPASTLLEVGSIVYIINQAPFQAGITCNQEQSLGKSILVQDSSAANHDLVSKVTNDFEVDSDYIKQIQADVEYKQINSVKLKLSNVKILEITDATVYKNLTNRQTACWKGIEIRKKNGFQIVLVKSVLKADVSYIVDFSSDASLDADVKREVLEGLAIKLGLENHTTSTNTIQGSQLFWGIIPDPILGSLESKNAIGTDLTISKPDPRKETKSLPQMKSIFIKKE